MPSVSELLFKLSFRGDTKDLQDLTRRLKDARTAAAATSAPTRAMARDLSSLEGQVRRTATAHQQLGREMSSLGTKMGLLITLPVVAFFKSAEDAAMSYGVQLRKTDVAFGQYAANVHAHASKAAKALGMGPLTYERAVGSLGTTLNEFGIPQGQSAAISEALVRREADVAAFTGGTPADVAAALQTAISGGRTMALKRFLVAFSTQDVVAEAQRLGLTQGLGTTGLGGAAGISDAAKAQATAQLFLDRSVQMQGALNRQKDTTIGKLRTEQAEWEQLKVTVGQDLQPVLNNLLTWGTGALNLFNEMPSALQTTTVGFLALAATAPLLLKSAAALIQIRSAALGAQAAGDVGLLARAGALFGGGAAGSGFLGGLALPLAPLAITAGIVGLVQSKQAQDHLNSAQRWVLSTQSGLDTSTVSGAQAGLASLNSSRAAQKAIIDRIQGGHLVMRAHQSGHDADAERLNSDLQTAKARYAELGNAADKAAIQVQTLQAAQLAADDEMGYTGKIRARIDAFDQLGKVADGTSKILATALAPMDVAAAQARLQTDELGIRANVKQYGARWLTSVAGIGSGQTIATDVGSIIDAQIKAGVFADKGQGDILRAAQSLFAQESAKIGITPGAGGVGDFMAALQSAIDAAGPIQVPITPVGHGTGPFETLAGFLQKKMQQGLERQTVPG